MSSGRDARFRVEGYVAEGFGALADALSRVIAFDDGAGSAFALYEDGRVVADLWGGWDDLANRAFPDDALLRVASCSKGITATVFGILIARGAIDPAARIADLWPEYAVNGKQDTTIEMVAAHLAGIPFPALGSGLRGVDYFTGARLLETLARQEPLWVPGTALGYHPATGGAVLDEICRRATGRRISEVLAAEIADPLGLSMWLGAPSEVFSRVVRGHSVDDDSPQPAAETDYARARQAAFAEAAPFEPDEGDPQEFAEYYGASMPSVGAVTDARSLARMYAATVSEVDGIRLLDADTVAEMTRDRTRGLPRLVENGTAGPDLAFGFGYQLPTTTMPGITPRSFGHTGHGARLGLADPETGMGVGFVCSRMRTIGVGGDPRWRILLDAVQVLAR
ncbi:CubicO group peptidase (beta-lactamase class C family) [Microbacterium endophyticum]|uniref:CubicO group peptidase (Beta-lactamase class C family) n=1 Tax=Microbacterium endophyticum TaxID=1526412 RepID=A0A7W4YPH1_9MICO|nr:serine hydrolase domain-containing protein [Microbacterium endophyticum]MBB2977137.1 CubicO group peptidase (beta-lactamase class C family) [Microbacterium endophyticum]NIK36065.1 CubicO group peptidase (beta-lactamase class C family) [Microbacterium endophyticum]